VIEHVEISKSKPLTIIKQSNNITIYYMHQFNFPSRIPTYQRPLMLYAHYLTKNVEDAKDLVQQTYLHALERESLYREDTNLAYWLRIMLKRIWLDGLPKKSRLVLRQAPEGSYTIDEGANADLLQVKKDLARMNKNDAKLVLLHAEGHSYIEIGSMLGMSPKYLRIRVHKTRLRLKRLYAEMKKRQ
jgi:RNA polymerase sigma factor (sigma-70 family)